ncbi:MAG: tail fiber domain-containing protein [Bacteroidota bacterium]
MKKLVLLFLLVTQFAFSQVGINTTDPKAQLDIKSSDQAAPSNTDGILIPKIDTFPGTIPTADQQGMMVYLTTVSAGKQPGFYYWDNTTLTWKSIGGTGTSDHDFYEVGTTTPPDAITDNMFHTGNVGIGNNNPTYKLDVDETAAGKIYAMRVRHSNPIDGSISSGIQSTISGGAISSGVIQGVSTSVTPASSTSAYGLRNLIGGTSEADVTGVDNTIWTVGSGSKTGISNGFIGTGTGITHGMHNAFSNPNAVSLGVKSIFTAAGIRDKTGVENEISNSTGGFHTGISNTFTNNNGAMEETGVFSQFTGSSVGNIRGIYNEITNSGSGNIHYGLYNNINGSGGLERYGVENVLSGTSAGTQYGVQNDISTSGTNRTHYGVRNYLSGTGTGSRIGTDNWLAGSGSGDQYGVNNYIDNSGVGNKYGVYNHIPSATNGLHYGVYSDVRKANSYAGYFLGRVSIGATTANNYILPLSRGTVSQIMQTDATGNVTWVSPSTLASGTLDQAYDFGGAGLGRTITADAGAVTINGTDGLVSTGTFGSGAMVPSAEGTRMVWNPRKAAFRAGYVNAAQWDDANIGNYSTAFGQNTIATSTGSTAFGGYTRATASYSTAFGYIALASGWSSTAFGYNTQATTDFSTAFGYNTQATASYSTAFGLDNTASSAGETVFGIGATSYAPSSGGTTDFRPANATDRLFVIGNAIDTNGDSNVDPGERSDAMVVLKNGNTGIGNSAPALARLQVQGAVGATVAMFGASANSKGVSVVADWPGIYFNSYYNGGTRAMSNTGFTSIVNTNQSTGGLIFQTTDVVNPAAGSIVASIPTRMTITGSGNVGIGTPAPGGQFELSLDQGRKPGTSTWTIPSDERLKTIHGTYSKGLEEILKLQPITYNYVNSGKRTFEEKTLKKEFSGFSAQAVQKVFPEAVGVDDDGFLNFNMHPIFVASVNALKELDLKNKELQIQLEQIKTQQEEINSLKAINAEILKRLEKLEVKQ